jgi:biopolymer transport protein ExbD
MGGMDIAEPKGQKKGVGLHRPKRRVAIRLDMTPMVDIAFLLLIFFMVTTVFRAPQAMEVNLPPPNAKVEVPESNVMTLFVMGDGRFFYRMAQGPLASTSMKDLGQLFTENEKLNPELIILVKVDRTAKYVVMVDVMDELEIANMARFSLVPMTDQEVKEVEATP